MNAEEEFIMKKKEADLQKKMEEYLGMSLEDRKLCSVEILFAFKKKL